MAGTALFLSACAPDNQSPAPSEADTVRFLEQATWGPNEATIHEARQRGFSGFLEDQFAAPASSLGTYPVMDPLHDYGCPAANADNAICVRDNYTAFPLQAKLFQNMLNGRDQLRQRVAFALSQIFVVSGREMGLTYALAIYHETLARHAFGNFRDILTAVTLSPVMGRYLNMVNSDKPDPVKGVGPNENYAREFLQLFSIGIHKMNPDGSVQIDEFSRPIQAYDQEAIAGFARALTGWTYPTRPGNAPQPHNSPHFVGSMIAVAENHDTGAKQLFDGIVLPAQQTAEKDLNDVVTTVFNHPNVAPFIGKQLIQHLVTSNPSPGYVGRISAVFNDNGRGIRGDMRAVIKAILLDPEARGDAKTASHFGKLREPAKFIGGIMRALNGRTDGVFPSSQSDALGQNIYQAPSVFNFYPPNYPLQGTDLVSPVSAIYTAAAVLNRNNFVYTLLYSDDGVAPNPAVSGASGTSIDISPLSALATDP